jgi:hypothetical protein
VTAAVGVVSALWRYPVSSMGGERLETMSLHQDGVVGDRIWGLVDAANERIASPGREKHFVTVPHGHARLAVDPGHVEISADGHHWAAPDDAAALEALAGLFGFRPSLRPYVPKGSDGFRPRYEHAPIHLVTMAALRSLREALPGSTIDERRFRPSLVVDWPDGAESIPEDGWLGRDIRIGGAVLRYREPCARCGFVTIAQDGLPLDVEVLRTIVKRHGRNFGIYCDVVQPGAIGLGDRVALA